MEFDSVIAEYVQKHTIADQKFRGGYLYQISLIEAYLGGMIASWFFQENLEKRQALVGYIINDINFNQKIKIFFKILKNHYSELYEKYPNLSKDFEEVRNLRNILAHSRLDTSIDYLSTKPENIRFEFYKNGRMEHHIFTSELIRQKLIESNTLFVQLSEIMVGISGDDSYKVKTTYHDSERKTESLQR